VFRERQITVPFLLGTMIELPRACVTADELAREAQFFSFGTNDLKLGICGEHGGEAGAVGFCDRLGMNYVSCSPFRVPIARLAAAQAALATRGTMDRTRATV